MVAKKTETTSKTAAKKEGAPAPTPGLITVNGVDLIGYGKGTAKEPINARVPLKLIKFDKDHNPRKQLPKEEVESMAASIKAHGLLEPVVIRPDPDNAGYFLLVAGEKRTRAHKLLELDGIDARIRTDEIDKWDAKAIAIVENDDRTGLSDLERGYAFKELIESGKKTEESIAKATGKHVRTIRRLLDLVKTDPATQKLVESGKAGTRAALELGKLDEATRKEVVKELQTGSKEITEETVRAKAKEIARGTEAEVTATANNRKKGASRAASLVVWRGNKAANAALSSLAVRYVEASKDDANKGTTEWYEMRGALAVLLYLRSDLSAPALPAEESAEAPAAPADKKVLVLFDKLVNAEATKAAKVARAQEAAEPEAAAGSLAEKAAGK